MLARYHIRKDRHGFTVFDIWTDEPLVIALMPQTGLTDGDAKTLADLMNRRALRGDRVLHQ
jgi:hypothetical protein